eukprot:1148117-Pelagomonas_calceolata.AAC.4
MELTLTTKPLEYWGMLCCCMLAKHRQVLVQQCYSALQTEEGKPYDLHPPPLRQHGPSAAGFPGLKDTYPSVGVQAACFSEQEGVCQNREL